MQAVIKRTQRGVNYKMLFHNIGKLYLDLETGWDTSLFCEMHMLTQLTPAIGLPEEDHRVTASIYAWIEAQCGQEALWWP